MEQESGNNTVLLLVYYLYSDWTNQLAKLQH